MVMINFNVDIHYHRMRKGYLLYSFRDVLTPELMQVIFQDIEEKLINESEDKIVQKRAFSILVELIQNIYNYTSSFFLKAPEVLVMVQKTDEGYELITGNFLEQKGVNLLESRLRMINFLNEEQLDNVYRGVLANKRISKQHGAGLGLLDVVRKSRNNIYFKIDAVDERLSFFTIKSLVKK